MSRGVGIVIAGAGQAACAAAASLRQHGYAQPIVMVGEENIAPYQRPPLSKALLLGQVHPDELLLRSADFYAEQSIELVLGDRIVTIDRERKHVETAKGLVLSYEHLILATGAEAFRPPLPGAEHPQVRVLRDLSHALDLKNSWRAGQHLCVIGGGFIGLEVAASARQMGLEVTVLEAADRLLVRVASVGLSEYMAGFHRRHGVKIELGQQVQSLDFHAPSGCRVRLVSGTELHADTVLLATGARPRDDLAKAAGLRCDRGVCVDAVGRTEDPSIWAIGDCAIGPAQPGRASRLESIPSGNEQARRVAALLTGRTLPGLEVPWFWSDQYNLKLQLAGKRTANAISVLRGDPATDRFSIFHVASDLCIHAVESVNDSSSFMAARTWLCRAQPLDLGRLADPTVNLTQVPISELKTLEEI